MWWIIPLATVKLSYFCILIYTNEAVSTPDSSLFLFISIFHRHAIYIKGMKHVQNSIFNYKELLTVYIALSVIWGTFAKCWLLCILFLLCSLLVFICFVCVHQVEAIYLRDWLHIAQKGRQPVKVEHSVPFLFSPCLSSMYFSMLLNW